MNGILNTIGLVTVIAFGLTAAGAIAGALVLRRRRATGRVSHPRFTLTLVGLLYYPWRALLRKVGRSPKKVELAAIDLMNAASAERFSRTPLEKRLFMLPQCLRHIDCPAGATYAEGINCRECGLCGIAEFGKVCRERGVRCYLAMGSQFALRILREQKPEAVMGVACSNDLFRTMYEVNRHGIPMVGQLLSKDGCVMTEVDWEAVAEKLFAGKHTADPVEAKTPVNEKT